MALPAFIAPALIWLGRIGLAAFAINEIKKLTKPQQDIIEEHTKQARAAGLTEDDNKMLTAALTYEKVEESGQDPDAFWNGLSPAEQEALKFKPDVVKEAMARTSFLGVAQTVLWVAAGVTAGIAAFRGIPIVSVGLGKLVTARAGGASALELMTIIEEVKMIALEKIWVPGFVAGLFATGGWLTGALANNMNDAFLWGRIFLDQAHQDVLKVQGEQTGKSLSSTASRTSTVQPKVIIRMVEEKKPEQFVGTLFSAKLGKLETFNRKVDDEITSEEDLLEDAKLNLNHWLATLPGRLGYSIVIRKDPVDEAGVKQSGLWATLTTHFTRLSGPIQPVDTILLGPVSPATRLKLTKSLKTVESQMPGILKGQEVIQVEIPSGAVDIFDQTGAQVDLSTPRVSVPSPSTGTPTTPTSSGTASAPATPTPLNTAGQTGTERAPELTSIPSFVVEPPVTNVQTSTPATPPPPTPPVATGPAQPDPWEMNNCENQRCGPVLAEIGVRQKQIVNINTGGGNLNARTFGSTSAPISFKIPNNTKVVVDSWDGEADGHQWARVRTVPGNRTGIVATDWFEAL